MPASPPSGGGRGPVDPNLPLQIHLEPYEKGDPTVVASLDGDRIVLRIVDREQMKTASVRSMKLDDAVSQAAWLVAMAEAGGLDNVFGRFQDELMEARKHVQARFTARFPKTTTAAPETEKKP